MIGWSQGEGCLHRQSAVAARRRGCLDFVQAQLIDQDLHMSRAGLKLDAGGSPFDTADEDGDCLSSFASGRSLLLAFTTYSLFII